MSNDLYEKNLNASRSEISRQSSRSWFIFPLLFGLYPVITLLADNIQELPANLAYRSIAFVLLSAILLILVHYIIFRDWVKSAALSTMSLILLFSYGHVYEVLRHEVILGILLGRHRYLIPLFALIFIAGYVFIATRKQIPLNVARILNVMGIGLLILPSYRIASHFFYLNSSWSTEGSQISEIGEINSQYVNGRPDIYYIILDAYARSDYMLQSYGYDNTEFTSFLENKGFYIADASHTNHNWTALSLASSLNMDFAQNLYLRLVRGSYPSVFVRPIQQSLARQKLEALGYSIVGTRTGYLPTEIEDGDYFFYPDIEGFEETKNPFSLYLNAFESLLINTSAGKIITDFTDPETDNWVGFRTDYPNDLLRGIILSQFRTLERIPEIPEPTFSFVHIVAPHSPYLFGPDGEPRMNNEIFTLIEEANGNQDTDLYRDQAIYITARIQEVIQTIIDRSPSPPIIILQADHGPSPPGGHSPEGGGLGQRTAILNAYYFPGGCDRFLYPSITPVNSFRILFNCYFGNSYELLPDNIYFSYWPRQANYYFIPVNDMILK